MKKILLSFCLSIISIVGLFSQIDCNQDYSITLNANGEAEVAIIDIVPNIEFLLTQGTVSYFIFPFTSGVISTSSDSIEISCQNRGLPGYIIELTDNGVLLENCTGTLVVTSPNGGCPGDNPDICGEDPDCSKIISGLLIADDFETEIFAVDIALCADALGCDGSYSIAYGLASDGPSLDFGNSILSSDATEYKNPITIFYTDESTTVFLQSYLYIWANAECLLREQFKTTIELDLTAEAQITADNFMTGGMMCENIGLALTGLNDPQPSNYVETVNVDCDNLGERLVWLRNTETGFTISKKVQIIDPLEACGTVLGPGDRLVRYTKGIAGLFFNTNIIINNKILNRHPGGIGWILNENDLMEGANTLQFQTSEYSLNGISTLDHVLGQRIILFDLYDHPRESVLFDIDQSGYNGIGDLITMREVILGINNGEGIPDAYFFNNSYVFPADFDPFDFDNTFTEYTFDSENFETEDFTFAAYKVGDVNDTAVPGIKEKSEVTSETRSSDASYLVTDMQVSEGEEFTFELKYESEEKFKGLLAALVGDGLIFKELTYESSPQVEYNILNDNEIRIFYTSQTLQAEKDEITFTITAESSKAGELVDLIGLKSGFPQEVVGDDNDVVPVDDLDLIVVSSVNIVGLDQTVNIFPNPASDRITIKAADADLTQIRIIDAIGRTVITESAYSTSHEIVISNLADGMYRMVITTDGGIQTASFVKE